MFATTFTIPDSLIGFVIGLISGFALCMVLFWFAAKKAKSL